MSNGTVQLSIAQQRIIDRVVGSLADIPNVVAVVLGGSHARGQARADSDIDIGLYYRNDAPFEIERIRALAVKLNDEPDPVVSGFEEWGRWVDGGAWLTIEGQRLDLLYRSLDKVEHTVAEARVGRFEVDTAQQPPFGFFGPTILGEALIAVPLHDPGGAVAALKAKVDPMPDALVSAIVQRFLWDVDFGLRAFAPKFAASRNVFGFAGCLTRFSHALVMALFALNGAYLLNDKTALAEISGFPVAPAAFETRIAALLSDMGGDEAAMGRSMRLVAGLFEETVALAGDLYKPAWRF